MCFYCKEAKERKPEKFTFEAMTNLHDHWRSQHPAEQPFQFYSVDLIQCNIGRCRYFSTFQGLQNHHKKQHPNENFVATMNGRCVLCHYSANDLDKHNCRELSKVQQLKLFNPILYTEETLAELQAANKQFGCKYCNGTFETTKEMLDHHRQQHG